MKNKKRTNVTLHPLSGGSFINWIKLLLENGGIDKKYVMRAFSISFLSLISIPFRILEKTIFSKKIEKVRIHHSPIFIIGHWRSGTTYLYNLMGQDENVGYVSTFQTFLPEIFLVCLEASKSIFNKLLPEQRPMDNIAVSTDVPEEEEYAIGNMCPYCFYHGWYFPKQMKKFFTQFVLFEQVSEKIKNEWKKTYITILKKATLNAKGKRLIIKNPSNTARIKILLEIFPDAKFIHIYRNPYTVYASTKCLYEKLVSQYFALQEVNQEEIEENIILFYKKLMQEFLKSKDAIPLENFIEVRYEELEKNEFQELKRIYNKFNLPGFEQAKESFMRYIVSQSNYKKNTHLISEETRKKIAHHWKFAIERWQYDMPENLFEQESKEMSREVSSHETSTCLPTSYNLPSSLI